MTPERVVVIIINLEVHMLDMLTNVLRVNKGLM